MDCRRHEDQLRAYPPLRGCRLRFFTLRDRPLSLKLSRAKRHWLSLGWQLSVPRRGISTPHLQESGRGNELIAAHRQTLPSEASPEIWRTCNGLSAEASRRVKSAEPLLLAPLGTEITAIAVKICAPASQLVCRCWHRGRRVSRALASPPRLHPGSILARVGRSAAATAIAYVRRAFPAARFFHRSVAR